jgi:uncharacterized protein
MSGNVASSPSTVPRPGAVSTVVIKANRLCNLRCPYCYYINAQTPKDHPTISHDTVERLYETVAEYLAGDSMPFAFVWHGGEPTLLGTKRFRSFIEMQREFFPTGRVENALQTNGTMISDDWCALFAEYDIKVGVSIDGYRELHDRTRITVKGKGTYDKVVANIALLKSRGIEVGVLMVVDGRADAATTLSALREIGIEYCDFLLPMSNNALQAISTEPYVQGHGDYAAAGKFLRSAFSALAAERSPRLTVRLFDSLIKNAFGLPHGYLNAGSMNVAENIILEPDGRLCLDADFWHIDRFLLGREYRLAFDIHASDFSFRTLECELGRLVAEKGLERLPTACQSCRVRSLCRASHPASRFGPDGDFNHRSAYCQPMFELCDEIVTYTVAQGYADMLIDSDLRDAVAVEGRGN